MNYFSDLLRSLNRTAARPLAALPVDPAGLSHDHLNDRSQIFRHPPCRSQVSRLSALLAGGIRSGSEN